MRVLVVEDSMAVRTRLVARLRDAGLEVIAQTASGRAALELAAALAPDAIVLDLRLADGNGLDLLPALAALVPRPLILVLTNAERAGYRERCLALGADHFLDKSTEFDQVAPTLAAAAG